MTTINNQLAHFPSTRYMGSKYKLLPHILKIIDKERPKSFLDAFSGSGCVSYAVKTKGIKVHSNDFLKFCFHIANASTANQKAKLTDSEIKMLAMRSECGFVSETFQNLYFNDNDNNFLDGLHKQIQKLNDGYKKSIAYAAIARAMVKRRPMGMFAYTGHRYDDGRRDLTLSLKEHFIDAAKAWNSAVFNSQNKCTTSNKDIFEITKNNFDMVYLDPPYMSKSSDNDYTRRYHLVEGFIDYWKNYKIQQHTKTKKIESIPSLFSSKASVYEGFDRLFARHKNSILVVSYSSNSIPSKSEMIQLLKKYKRQVEIIEIQYRYTFGNHSHKVGNNKNLVQEYLFVAK